VNESVTQQICSHPSTGQDRDAAEMIARLIAEAVKANETGLPAPLGILVREVDRCARM
jgi:hypothetical protein